MGKSTRSKWLLAILLLSVVWASGVRAGEIMARVESSGKLRVGFREGAAPFAWLDQASGTHRGFSVDMANLLAHYLSLHFGREIEIVPITVRPDTRIPLLLQGAIDVEMGSTSYTQEREAVVDFSVIFFMSETTFLVRSDSGIKSLHDLDGKRVASARGTTNLEAVQALAARGEFRPAQIVVTHTHPEGMLALERGEIDAYATDRTLLQGMRMKDPQPHRWAILDFAIAYEPYAYALPEDNSDFRDFLNDTIRWAVTTGAFFDIYDKWMGPGGPVPIKMSPAFKDYLNIIAYPMKPNWWMRR